MVSGRASIWITKLDAVRRGNILCGVFVTLAATKQEVLDWLSPLDVDTKHKTVTAKTVKGSGGWLLSDPIFTDWASGTPESNFLYCRGLRESLLTKDH